jgi:hypothetical protein
VTVSNLLSAGHEVIVVDDGSQDETVAVLELPVVYIRHAVNLGQGAREHPYHADRDVLAASLPEQTLQMGSWLWLTAWLPSDAVGPLPSEDRIAPASGRHAAHLAPCGVHVLGAAAGCLHDLLVARRRQPIAEWRFGGEGTFLERVHELAGALVARQQFLPGIIQEGRHWFAEWYPVYDGHDLKRIEQLAEAMPVSVRALNWDAHRPPVDTPHWIVDSLVTRLVGSLVKRAELQFHVYELLPEALRRRGAWSLEDCWLEAILVPGTEMRGRKRELMSLAFEIGDWRAPLNRLPRLELGDDHPAISLRPDGEGFWEGGKLPGPIECPAVPRRRAAVLERVGEFPNWRRDRSLRDALEPVYDAASRYALEHVFGQKPELPLHRIY